MREHSYSGFQAATWCSCSQPKRKPWTWTISLSLCNLKGFWTRHLMLLLTPFTLKKKKKQQFYSGLFAFIVCERGRVIKPTENGILRASYWCVPSCQPHSHLWGWKPGQSNRARESALLTTPEASAHAESRWGDLHALPQCRKPAVRVVCVSVRSTRSCKTLSHYETWLK